MFAYNSGMGGGRLFPNFQGSFRAPGMVLYAKILGEGEKIGIFAFSGPVLAKEQRVQPSYVRQRVIKA